jgi:hypothetical protein
MSWAGELASADLLMKHTFRSGTYPALVNAYLEQVKESIELGLAVILRKVSMPFINLENRN